MIFHSLQISESYEHCHRRQRAPGPKIQGGCVTSQFLILESLMDPSHLENGFLIVAMEALGEGNAAASLSGSSQHVKGLTFYFTFRHHERGGSHTHSYQQEAAAGVT